MDKKTFLENFRIIADAPNGIQQLRKTILRLAVEGFLTDQKPGDGSISESLASVSDGEVSERLDRVDQQDHLERSNWVMAGFRHIGKWVGGNGFPTAEQGESSEKILFCKVSDMNREGNEKYIVSTANTISDETASRLRVTVHSKGTVVFPKIGGAIATNKRRIIVSPTAIDNNCMGVTPSSAVDSDWLYVLLMSYDLTKYQTGTSLPALSQRALDQIEFGVPPLPEQQRIVAKVDELMALCDELESEKAKQETLRTAARASAIDAISTAATPVELATAWSRISNHWEVMADSSAGIESLRQLIISIAVKGQLTSASQIRDSEHVQLLDNSTKLDESKLWLSSTLPVDVPKGWLRAPMGLLGQWGSGGTPTSTRKEYYTNGTIPWAVIGDLNEGELLSTEKSITTKALAESSATMIPKGSVLIAMYGASIGKTAITAIECCSNQAIAHCIPGPHILAEYLLLLAKSLKYELIDSGQGAAQPNISQTVLKHLLVDVPPIRLQHEIFGKVDKLMALCDELELSLIRRTEIESAFSRASSQLLAV